MRDSVVLLLALILTVSAQTNERSDDSGGGGGGGPLIRYYFYDNSQVDSDFGGSFLVIGGRGYGAVNGWLRIGGGGASSLTVLGAPDDENVSMSISFGGLILEPYFDLTDQLTVSLPLLVGGGSYEFQHIVSREGDDFFTVELYEAGFFCLEPGIELTWTPLDWFGLGLQGGYIWAMDEKDHFNGSGYIGLMLFFGII